MGMRKIIKTYLGFTLVEVMVVVAITSLLASLTIPNAVRARINANEAYVINSLRRISTACESFRSVQPQPTYPAALTDLSDSIPPYLTPVLTGGSIKGYSFTYTPNLPNQYTCTATPVTPGSTGVRTFVVDETGVITSNGVPIE